MHGLAAALLLLAAGAATAQPTTVRTPSGRSLQLAEILADENPGALWLRFRFVAPGLAAEGDGAAQDIAADMDWLCASLVLPYLERHGLAPARVVLSVSDRPVPFGRKVPEARQFFETYRPEGGRCIWEGL